MTDAKGRVIQTAPYNVPESFLASLKAFDQDLFISWSAARERYFIYQCAEHVAAGQPISCGHTQLCRAVYVLVVQDREGTRLPLNERVLATLCEMRAESDRFGGQTERGLRNYRDWTKNVDEEQEARREAAVRDAYDHNRRWNRVSFNRLWNWAETHLFTAPNR